MRAAIYTDYEFWKLKAEGEADKTRKANSVQQKPVAQKDRNKTRKKVSEGAGVSTHKAAQALKLKSAVERGEADAETQEQVKAEKARLFPSGPCW